MPFALLVLAASVLWYVGSPKARRNRRRRGRWWAKHKEREFWANFAAAYGLAYDLDRRRAPFVRGKVQGIDLEIRRPTQRGRKRDDDTIQFVADTELRGFSVLPAVRRTGADDVTTGDEVFDAEAVVHGDATIARAALDRTARTQILALLRSGGRIVDGNVILDTGRNVGTRERARQYANLIYLSARSLAHVPDERVDRLAHTLQDDPDPEVRANALHELLVHAPDDPRVAAAATRAQVDRSEPLLTGVAAWHRRDSTTLRELADPDAYPLPVVRGALRALGGGWAREAQLDAIRTVLDGAKPEVMLEALQAAANLLPDARATAIAHALHRGLGPETWRLLTRIETHVARGVLTSSLRTLGVAQDEPLSAALQAAVHHPDDEISSVALEMLGEKGTVRDIEPLLELESASSRLGSRRGQIRTVIDAIQARLGEVERGRVSLAVQGVSGGLSLAEDRAEAGRVSVASADDTERRERAHRQTLKARSRHKA